MPDHSKDNPLKLTKRGKRAAAPSGRVAKPLQKGVADAKGHDYHHVSILDDDIGIVETIGDILEAEGYVCRRFTRAERCLSELISERCDVLLTDMVMPGADYIEFLGGVLTRIPWLPVIVMTGYGTVGHAVTAIKNGAWNFIEKPLETTVLLDSVDTALKTNQLRWDRIPKALTYSESLVLGQVLWGRKNSQIAKILGKSIRTIEDHRAHMMRKLEVDNAVALVKLCIQLGVICSTSGQHIRRQAGHQQIG